MSSSDQGAPVIARLYNQCILENISTPIEEPDWAALGLTVQSDPGQRRSHKGRNRTFHGVYVRKTVNRFCY